MATTKNITIKQYNGTDYDTLYPATTPAQTSAVSYNAQTLSDSQKTQARTNIAAPNVQYSTTDITAGTTALPTGDLYVVYE